MFAKTVDHVEIFVRDLDAAVAWYCRALAMREVGRWDPHPVMIGADGKNGTKIALFRTDAEKPAFKEKPPGWRLVAFQATEEEMPAVCKHLESLGIAYEGPVDRETNVSIYFEDPEGNELEITFNR